ncbi:glycosyltransferase family 4 protein [Photobacterium leiognathi]|uniref:glycosyltransferase family 4 protein n=1 Tax=Photobacterium leiognathi TaxID=553611 RepID=UPI0029810A19|nr:glycosyltransferase family 4 protein [Photobacterium leiognathi]
MNFKILMFSHEYPPYGGGAGVVASQFIKELSSHNNIKVDLLTHSNVNKELFCNETYHVTLKKGMWLFNYAKYIKNNINLDNYDYIICNDIISIHIAGLFFSKKHLNKTILFLHGSEPEYFIEEKNIKYFMFFNQFSFKRAVKHSKKIVCHSKYMMKKFESSMKDNDWFGKTKVIYFGYDSEIFNKGAKSSVNNVELNLLTVSRIEKKKGFLRKLILFNTLVNELKVDAHWDIIGTGSYIDEFKDIVKSFNLKHRVKFLGNVKRDRLKKHYYKCDLFWLLSEYKESFGLVYIEAQACGTTVIGNNSYGVKEAIINNQTGFLVDNDEQLIDIFTQKKYQYIDSDECVKFASQFTSKKATEQLLNEMNIL